MMLSEEASNPAFVARGYRYDLGQPTDGDLFSMHDDAWPTNIKLSNSVFPGSLDLEIATAAGALAMVTVGTFMPLPALHSPTPFAVTDNSLSISVRSSGRRMARYVPFPSSP
jgi:hypothetical protein